MSAELHESLTRDEEEIGSSDRAFGLTFAVIGGLIGAVKLWRDNPYGWLWLGGGAVFLAAALLAPRLLAPLNRLWLRLGLLLYRIVNPVVMAVLFYATILPIGLLMRARGKDLLRLKRDLGAASYWIAREPGPAPESMKQQF